MYSRISESMLVPSGSIAKTFFALIAALTLEQEFGNVMSAKIGTLIDEAATSWNSVSIEDALDMATGHYRFVSHGLDDATTSKVFDIAETHSTKLLTALNSYRRRSSPGERWVYHTTDIYIAGVALRNLFTSLTGSDNILLYLDLKVFQPLELSSIVRNSIRTTYDDIQQPLSTTGMFLTVGDAIKLGRFLNPGNKSRGKIKGKQILDAAALDASLQLNPENRGFFAYNDYLYNKGFFSRSFSLENCENFNYVPYTQAKGPSVVALFPNNATYVYFSDSTTPDDDPEFSYEASEIAKLRC